MGRILLIGSERARTDGLRSILRQDGHEVRWRRTVDGWSDEERDLTPELVVAAVGSVESVLEARRRVRRGFPAPLLFIQREADSKREIQLEDRVVDRLDSPFMSEELLGRVDALIRVRRVILRASQPASADPDDVDDREATSAWRRVASRLTAVLGTRVPRFEKPLEPYLEVAARVAEWADARDGFDPGHAERVANLCGIMADGLGLTDRDAASLIRAAMLHDIGKVALPIDLLRMQGPLDDGQMRLMRTHAERGATLLRALDTEDHVAETILLHHERADGSGYHGKTLDELPVSARILAVAEMYDAMTRSRVRETLTPEDALDRLERERGVAFDPDCVNALARTLRPRRHALPVSGLLGN